MKTKEQYFKEAKEQEKIKAKERERKWRNEITDEIFGWMYHKLKEEYIKLRLSRISYSSPISSIIVWKYCHEECRFCDLEYIQGEHDECCDNCWEENKDKTLSELE